MLVEAVLILHPAVDRDTTAERKLITLEREARDLGLSDVADLAVSVVVAELSCRVNSVLLNVNRVGIRQECTASDDVECRLVKEGNDSVAPARQHVGIVYIFRRNAL